VPVGERAELPRLRGGAGLRLSGFCRLLLLRAGGPRQRVEEKEGGDDE
jgi:hypothetical protein